MTPLELKIAFRELRERVNTLESRVADLEKRPVSEPVKQKTERTCPHCGIAPAYFFHVKACAAKKQKHGDDRSGTPQRP